MVQLWVLIGLIVSATAISVLGAAFSIVGLGKLFAGAMVAVWLMAGALELSKFVIAAFLHQTWKTLNFFFKIYLFVAVIVLSLITSMGIFGFLSDAYQESTTILEAETIKLEAFKADQVRLQKEADRIIQSIEEIPATRITRKLQARAEAAPLLQRIGEENDRIAKQITEANLRVLEVKGKIGPLIYISKAFKVDIDSVVKWLILLFVAVFDPLAICLVVAVSESITLRKEAKQPVLGNLVSIMEAPATAAESVTEEAISAEPVAEPRGSHAEGEDPQLRSQLKMRFSKSDSDEEAG
jgi:hypothetical protein